jgi:hypothetical protein
MNSMYVVPSDSDISPKPSLPPNVYSFNNGTDNSKTIGGYSYKPAWSPTPAIKTTTGTSVRPFLVEQPR